MIKELSQKGIIYSLYFIAVSFPLHYNISNFGLAFLVFSWLVNVASQRKFRITLSQDETKLHLALLGFYLLYVTALFYTSNFDLGVKFLEYKLSFLVLPIVFSSISLQRKTIDLLLKCYSISIALCTFLLLTRSIYYYLSTDQLLVYEEFSSIIDLHAIFLSYYIFFALVIISYLAFNGGLKVYEKQLGYIAIFVLVVGLVFLASKNVILILLLFSAFYFGFKLLRNKLRIKEFLFSFLTIVCIILLSFQLPIVQDRMVELSSISGVENIQKIKDGEKLEHEDRVKFNGTSLRLTLWYLGTDKLIDDNKLFLGLSPGDYKGEMNQVYQQVGLNPWYLNYNMHNQFVQILVELGLIGLLVYLFIYFMAIKIGLKFNNYLLIVFVVGILFFQMSEAVLERNKGIVFVVFFLLLLPKYIKSN